MCDKWYYQNFEPEQRVTRNRFEWNNEIKKIGCLWIPWKDVWFDVEWGHQTLAKIKGILWFMDQLSQE